MKIAIASDHAGFLLKKHLIDFLNRNDYEVEDVGSYSTNTVDYPDYAALVAQKVLQKEVSRGVLICGTGVGMAISANKIPGIRAAVAHDTYSAKSSVLHNDVNILAMGARVIGSSLAEEIVTQFLMAKYEGGRHQQRLQKIQDLEKGIIPSSQSTG